MFKLSLAQVPETIIVASPKETRQVLPIIMAFLQLNFANVSITLHWKQLVLSSSETQVVKTHSRVQIVYQQQSLRLYLPLLLE